MTIDIKEILSLHAKWLAGEDGGERADLVEANLSRANLSRADLVEANLSGCTLSEANLVEANLSGAFLYKANLYGANLYGADLSEADLYGANLYGANLSGAVLDGSNLSRAKGIVSFGPVGKEKRIGYAVKHESGPMVQLGCFWGALDQALAAIEKKYGENSKYAAIVSSACACVMED